MTCRIEPAAPPPSRPATPLPAALDWIAVALERLRGEGLERPHRIRDGRQGGTVELDGRRLVNVGSNDYLGYAGDVRLTKAASKAACAEGFGAGASPLVSGHSRAHERLERALADLLDVPATMTFPSGFAANSATIAALVGPDDAIYSDERNHASIIDGCRLSRATVHVYPHRDVAALDHLDRDGANTTLNLGTGHGCSVLEVLRAVEAVSGKAVPHEIVSRRAGDPAIVYADASLAERTLGWKATRGLTEIVSSAYSWHVRHMST